MNVVIHARYGRSIRRTQGFANSSRCEPSTWFIRNRKSTSEL